MERQHRVILISGIISAVLGLLAGFLGGRLAAPGPPEAGAVMRAQHFQLVDQAGAGMASWESMNPAAPGWRSSARTEAAPE